MIYLKNWALILARVRLVQLILIRFEITALIYPSANEGRFPDTRIQI